ncbi:PepSY-associated TM helix domain-containing protein [Chitinasiproducens palmae]|uniref:Uncharacterized iron-regulated membrane protein n=1 Tax=Chitinasiproducens palmae TaxID=1770053 RepID=A0A1H2PIV2_9BURK|nr:PepSY domain-containing protein [Chitinasiproducens palmae]SDV46242.1 Uncharacterized iron-regulated membrane protein [Chitinasiproducens palmae]
MVKPAAKRPPAKSRTRRIWQSVHTWSSLACAVLLLLLCLTGLPLIFHDEIDAWLDTTTSRAPEATPAVIDGADGIATANLDRLVDAVARQYHDERVQYVIWSDDDDAKLKVNLAPPAGVARGNRLVTIDMHAGRILGSAWSEKDWRQGSLMTVVLTLHTDMLLGLTGSVIYCAIGALFLLSLLSGAVLYGRFMTKLAFGTVRAARGARIHWLDLHNLLGIVTLAWAVLMAATGMLNTLDAPLFGHWQKTELAMLLSAYRDAPPVVRPASLSGAIEAARRATPDRTPSFVAFPGSFFSSRHHYTVYMHGTTPLTSRLLVPVLVDARNLTVSKVARLPWYLIALEASRPLHFGDYAGWPMKVLWALLDCVTIVVLASGLYLWLAKRRPAASEATAGRSLSRPTADIRRPPEERQ